MRGSTLDVCRRQILTTKVYLRTVRVEEATYLNLISSFNCTRLANSTFDSLVGVWINFVQIGRLRLHQCDCIRHVRQEDVCLWSPTCGDGSWTISRTSCWHANGNQQLWLKILSAKALCSAFHTAFNRDHPRLYVVEYWKKVLQTVLNLWHVQCLRLCN